MLALWGQGLTLSLTVLLWAWETFDKYLPKEGEMEGREREGREGRKKGREEKREAHSPLANFRRSWVTMQPL